MSPVSRGRKKPAKPKSRRSRQASPYAPILAEAEHLLHEKSMLVAEVWASNLLGSIWSAAWADEDADPSDFMVVHLNALLEHMVTEGTPVALAVLRALAAVGEEWMRELAGEAADAVARRGVPEPMWHSSEEAHLSGAYSMSDPFGDIELVLLGFDRNGEHHAVVVLLAHIAGSYIEKILVTGSFAGGVDAIAESLRGEASFSEATALSDAQVLARLDEPLVDLLDGGPPEGGPLDEIIDLDDMDGDAASGWALLHARLDTLPDAADDVEGDDDPVEGDDDPVEGDGGRQAATSFLSSAYADALPDRELARLWAHMASDWALDSTGAAYRYGPLSLGFFLMAEVTQHVAIVEADLALLPDIIRAWAHFTVDAGGLAPRAHHLWDEHLPILLEGFAAAYVHVDSVTHRAGCSATYELRGYVAGASLQGSLERLYEAMPARMRGQLEAAASANPVFPVVKNETTRG
jgi:hypothetical protein